MGMDKRTLTLGHSPDPDDAFMFYGLAKELIPDHGYKFTHILQEWSISESSGLKISEPKSAKKLFAPEPLTENQVKFSILGI